MADSEVAAVIARAGGIAQIFGTGSSYTFPLQAMNVGDAVVVHSGCNISTGTVTGYTLTASGWTFTHLTGIVAQGTLRGATLIAIAPNTASVIATGQWLGGASCVNWNLNSDEFTNSDPAGDTMTFEASTETGGNNDCTAIVTTAHDHDAIWAACTSSGALNGIGPGYTMGTNDTAGDRSEYKVTTDPAGTVETATFPNPGQSYVMGMVAIKPRAL
jgi:hypothetical protein